MRPCVAPWFKGVCGVRMIFPTSPDTKALVCTHSRADLLSSLGVATSGPKAISRKQSVNAWWDDNSFLRGVPNDYNSPDAHAAISYVHGASSLTPPPPHMYI